jgi:hypothetical protein
VCQHDNPHIVGDDARSERGGSIGVGANFLVLCQRTRRDDRAPLVIFWCQKRTKHATALHFERL